MKMYVVFLNEYTQCSTLFNGKVAYKCQLS